MLSMAINLRTANAPGLAISRDPIHRADEVVE